MSGTAGPDRVRPARRLALAAVAVATATTLFAACNPSGDDGGAKPSPAATAIPTRDVVSGVRTDPALHAELPAADRARGGVSLGTTLVPGTFALPLAGRTADGRIVGLDVDLRDAVARVLGTSWRIQNGSFATVIPGVQNGKYEVGQDNFGVTRDREKVVDFATYLKDGQSFLVPRNGRLTRVTALTDLCGLVVAAVPGSTFQQILTRGAASCRRAGKRPYTVRYFTDRASIFLGLANGRIDVYFGPTLILKHDATRVPGTRFIGQLTTMPVGFVTAKGSPLAKAISDAVNELIDDGTYARILAKWGVGGIGVTRSEVSPPSDI
jgi:polar amino acid transport system substrate-binding protein